MFQFGPVVTCKQFMHVTQDSSHLLKLRRQEYLSIRGWVSLFRQGLP